MIYRLLKFLCQVTIRSYFRRVRIIGKEKIPTGVPCIFIANHPSAFMDPMVVATTVKQPVYFIAAGEYVGGGVKGWFFKKFLHMIPVFRPGTRPEDVHKNKDMFNHCFDHLSSGGSLLIFPEGISITERKIKPFKTGLARIARGAELKNKSGLNIRIVPVGLNYSDPHRFRSDLFVNIGEPIPVKNFISNHPDKEIEEVDRLTELAEDSLHKAVIHLETADDEVLLDRLNAIYSRDLKVELDIDYKEQEREFKVQKEMIEAIRYFKENQPEKFDTVNASIAAYSSEISRHGLTDKDIMEIKIQKSFRRITSYILGFPFFLVGVAGNFLPYLLVDFLSKRIRVHDNFRGSIVLAIGLFAYLGFYILVSLLVGLLTAAGWFALLLPFVLYACGVYALLYLSAIRYSARRKNLRAKLHSDKEKLQELVAVRRKLIADLDNCRAAYDLTKTTR